MPKTTNALDETRRDEILSPFVFSVSCFSFSSLPQVFQQLQQQFMAFLLTILAHFILGFQPILLLQIFSAPYHFSENRLLRKLVLGLKPGYRVWGERFEGEVEPDRVKGDEDGGLAVAVAAAAEGDVKAATPAAEGDDASAATTVRWESCFWGLRK